MQTWEEEKQYLQNILHRAECQQGSENFSKHCECKKKSRKNAVSVSHKKNANIYVTNSSVKIMILIPVSIYAFFQMPYIVVFLNLNHEKLWNENFQYFFEGYKLG